jgi:hypothetical protein
MTKNRKQSSRYGRPGLFDFAGENHSEKPKGSPNVISRHSGLYLLPGPEALRAGIQRIDKNIRQIIPVCFHYCTNREKPFLLLALRATYLATVRLHSIPEPALCSDSGNWPEQGLPAGTLYLIGMVPGCSRCSFQETVFPHISAAGRLQPGMKAENKSDFSFQRR